MRVIRFGGASFVLVGVLVFFVGGVCAQESASSASVARTRAITSASMLSSQPKTSGYYRPNAIFTPPDEVAVEEFINYHKHRLPPPKAGYGVAMDTRWGNNKISVGQREAILQIGFTTAEVNERTDLRPLNLALVIDKSGSMAADDKMSRVKESLRTMIGKLRSDDIVSIVTFDTGAQVLFPASRIGDGYELRRAIDCIEPGGSTNLHGGLMLGYKEAGRNFREGSTNRVILLTDGIANVGVVNPQQIASASSEFNGQGIDLSTIGVGLELNNELLRTLARSGRGLYHFISDYQDIDKVFVNEVQSLISSVAKRVELNVDPDPSLRVEKVFGYSPRYRGNGFSIGLDDMNNGLTQVVMIKFRPQNNHKISRSVKIRLSYYNVKQKRMVEELQEVRLDTIDREFCETLADVEVKKNYSIAELAQSLFDMTAAAKAHNYREAENLLNASTLNVYRRYPNMEDKDIKFILNIVEGYQRDLRALGRTDDGGDRCGSCE